MQKQRYSIVVLGNVVDLTPPLRPTLAKPYLRSSGINKAANRCESPICFAATPVVYSQSQFFKPRPKAWPGLEGRVSSNIIPRSAYVDAPRIPPFPICEYQDRKPFGFVSKLVGYGKKCVADVEKKLAGALEAKNLPFKPVPRTLPQFTTDVLLLVPRFV